jgi:hypothetical protein
MDPQDKRFTKSMHYPGFEFDEMSEPDLSGSSAKKFEK